MKINRSQNLHFMGIYALFLLLLKIQKREVRIYVVILYLAIIARRLFIIARGCWKKFILHFYIYSVHASCTNALGQSRSSKNVEELQTLGQVPEAPSNPIDFVHPSNTSVRLDLFMWNKQTCPVEYFIVSYRREKVCIVV